MGVPVHQWSQVKIHIKDERECLLLEVAIVQKLINLGQVELDVIFKTSAERFIT